MLLAPASTFSSFPSFSVRAGDRLSSCRSMLFCDLGVSNNIQLAVLVLPMTGRSHFTSSSTNSHLYCTQLCQYTSHPGPRSENISRSWLKCLSDHFEINFLKYQTNTNHQYCNILRLTRSWPVTTRCPDLLEYSQYHCETKIPISQKPFKRFAKYLLIGLSCERYWSKYRECWSYLFLSQSTGPATVCTLR